MPYFFISAIILVGIAVSIFQSRREKKRTSDLQILAKRLNMNFIKNRDSSRCIPTNQFFRLFSNGCDHRVYNILEGAQDGAFVKLFDYSYVSGKRRNAPRYDQSVLIFESGQLQIPHFYMRPEDIWDEVKSVLGYSDINFESHPGFSRKYFLKAKHDKSIRDFFSIQLLDYFTNDSDWFVEGKGNVLILSKINKKINPDDIEAFLNLGIIIKKKFRVASEEYNALR